MVHELKKYYQEESVEKMQNKKRPANARRYNNPGDISMFQIAMIKACLFNLHAEYIIRNAGLEEAQAGIKIAGRNINNLRYADDITLMAESEEELKSLFLVKSERGE